VLPLHYRTTLSLYYDLHQLAAVMKEMFVQNTWWAGMVQIVSVIQPELRLTADSAEATD